MNTLYYGDNPLLPLHEFDPIKKGANEQIEPGGKNPS